MPLGPLTGFLSGMNQDLANQATQREFQNDDLQKILTQLSIQENQGTLQSKIDKANYEGEKAKTDQSMLSDYAATAKAKYASEKATSDLQTTEADIQSKLAPAKLWLQMSEEAKVMGDPDPMNPNWVNWWEGWRQKLKSYAPNMPAMAGAGDMQLVQRQGMQAAAVIQKANAISQAAVNTAPQQQALAAITAKGNIEKAVEEQRATAQQNVANTHAAATVEAARIGAGARENSAEIAAAANRSARDNIIGNILRAANKFGGVDKIPEDQLSVFRQQMRDIEWQSRQLTLPQTMAYNDPGKMQQLRAQAYRQADIDFNNMLGRSNNSSSNTQSTPNVGATPTINDKTSYEALPSGATYVDGRDGKTKVKK